MKNKWHIETRLIAELVPHPKNPRQFTKKGIADLGRSIDAFGLAEPIVVNTDNTICGGHARVMVLKQRGETECECYVPDRKLTEKEVEQLMIRLNANQAGVWNTERLANEWDLSELMDWGLDLPEFRNLEAQEDDYIIPDEIVTDIKRGDLFQIGEHFLMCGDSTKAEDVEKLMNGEKADICFTSPPYNMGDSSKIVGNKNTRVRGSQYQQTDDLPDYLKLISDSLKNALIFSNAAAFNVQMLAGNKIDLIKWILSFESNFCDIITWNKENAAPSAFTQGVLTSCFEWICIFNPNGNSRAIPLSNFRGNVKNVYTAPPQRNNNYSDIHGATFPIHLPDFILREVFSLSRSIIDLFCGTGTTMVAAHQLNRRCFGMEIDERYCAVIIDRMKKAFPEIEIKQIN